MSEVTILDLSQQSSSKVNSNGDWETTLSKEIKLNENDELSIKNVFVDTVSVNDEKINIQNDLTVTMEVGLYNVNWSTTDKSYNIGTATYQPDGTPYVVMKYTTSGVDLQKLEYIEYAMAETCKTQW